MWPVICTTFRASAGRISIGPVERKALSDLAGKRVLHLECHFGQDTISLARLGAREVVGVDFSPTALAEARRLAEQTGTAKICRFVEADVLDLDLGERFDVVFTSQGTIVWLADIGLWGRVVAKHLAPDGFFYILDTHPAGNTIMSIEGGRAREAEPYFRRSEPTKNSGGPDYADPNLEWSGSHQWFWALADVFAALETPGPSPTNFASIRSARARSAAT